MFATYWAWLFFSERPGPQTLIGAAVVIAGVLLGTVFNPEARAAARAARIRRAP